MARGLVVGLHMSCVHRQPYHGGGRPGPPGQRAPQPGPQGPYRGAPPGAGPPKHQGPYQGQRQPVHARADARGAPRQGGPPPAAQRGGYQPAAGGYGSGYGACVRGRHVDVLYHVAQGGLLDRGRAARRLARRVGTVHRRVVCRAMGWSTRDRTVGREGRRRSLIGVGGKGLLRAGLSGTTSGVDEENRLCHVFIHDLCACNTFIACD